MARETDKKISAKDVAVILKAADIEIDEIAAIAGTTSQAVSKAFTGKSAKPATVRKFAAIACNELCDRMVRSLASAA